jgi:hypothetical protein
MSKVYQVYTNTIDIIDFMRAVDERELHEYLSQDGYKLLEEMYDEYVEDLENDEDLEVPEYDIDVVISKEFNHDYDNSLSFQEIGGNVSFFIRYNGIFLHLKNVEQDEHLNEHHVPEWINDRLLYFADQEDEEDDNIMNRQDVLTLVSELPNDF